MIIFTFIDPVAKQTQSPVKPTPSDKPILFGDVTCKLSKVSLRVRLDSLMSCGLNLKF